jgi:hypothetical protein
MLPLRDPQVQTGHADDLSAVGADVDDPGAVAAGWDLTPFRDRLPASLRDRWWSRDDRARRGWGRRRPAPPSWPG